MRWWKVAAPLVLAGVAAGGLAVALPSRSELRFTDETPQDLRMVASDAWERFADTIPACQDRLDAPTVGVAWELPDRARYEPGPAFVLIRAPGTAANLEASLLHEYAHHAEHRCGLTEDFRRRFTAAGGLPAATPWRAGPSWSETPSERFAEAVVVLVLGRRPPHVLIHLHPREVRAVASWARGE